MRSSSPPRVGPESSDNSTLAERASSTAFSGGLLLVAAGAAYVGVGVAVTLIASSLGTKAIAAGAAYFLGAFLGPALVAVFLHRRRGRSWSRSIRVGAGFCIAVHLLLIPIAVAAMAM